MAIVASAQEIELELEAFRLGPFSVSHLHLFCPEWKNLGCPDGALSFEFPPFGAFSVAPFVFRFSEGQIRLAGRLEAFGGRGEFFFERQGRRRRGALELRNAQLSSLTALWREWVEQLEGRLNFRLSFEDRNLTLKLEGEGISFDRAGYTQALAGGKLEATFRRQGQEGSFQLELTQGEGLYAPLYWNFRATPITLHGRFSGEKRLFADIEQKGVIQAFLRRQGESSEIEVRAPFPAFFRHYLAPFLEGGMWEGFRVLEGRLWGKVSLEGQTPRVLLLDLWGGVVDDPQQRLGLRDVLLSIRWQRALFDADLPPFPVSLIAWSKGYLLRLPLGEAMIFLKSFDDDLRLAFPVEVPFVDGVFRLRDLQILDAGEPERQVVFSAEIRDVSLEALTAALGLPPFSGKVSGEIPRVVYRNRVLALEGQIVIDIFDGRVVVSRMELIDPFGALPQLKADLRFEGLNLEEITKRFDFGAMGGTLNGYVRDLYLVRGKVVSFDAWLETPADDPRSHYLTQKAVQNLVKLSGIPGAVTKFYLGFFKWFSYDRIGFGCRLRRGICEIRSLGIRPDGSFYLLRGSPFKWPRVDVIGYNRLMDWNAFLARLKRVVRFGPRGLSAPASAH